MGMQTKVFLLKLFTTNSFRFYTFNIIVFTCTRILLIGRQKEYEKNLRVLNAPISYHRVGLKVIDDHTHML